MDVEEYELRCSRTSQVKMFSSMSAEKARRLNRLLGSSGSSFRFVPRSVVRECDRSGDLDSPSLGVLGVSEGLVRQSLQAGRNVCPGRLFG